MNKLHDNTIDKESFSIQPVIKKQRYVNINENIVLTLPSDSLKLYMIFRFESDYHQSCSSVDKNVKFLMNKSGFSRRQVFYALSELEKFGLLLRQANPGYQSTYWIADNLGHFTEKKSESTPPKNNESTESTEVVHHMHGVVHHMHGVVHHMHPLITNLSTNSFQEETIVDFQSTENYSEDDLFMLFYNAYPRKEKPHIARKAFYKHKPTEKFVSMLLDDLKNRKENNWKNRPKDKIPFPSTYLNGKEWEGEIFKADNFINSSAVKKYKNWDDIAGACL